jgi:hypothetical protein
MIRYSVPDSLDLRQPRYTRSEVLNMVDGVKGELLNLWISREGIPLDGENPGKGNRRLFSAMDTVRIAIIGQLTGVCVSVKTAVKVAEICADWTENHALPSWSDYFLIPTPAYRFDEKMAAPQFHSGHAYNQVLGVMLANPGKDGPNSNVWNALYPGQREYGLRARSTSNKALSKLRRIAHPFAPTPIATVFVPIGDIVNTILIRVLLREADENPDILEASGLGNILDGGQGE